MVAGKEALGSMGVDTPLAVLSQLPRPPSAYFKQLFAQARGHSNTYTLPTHLYLAYSPILSNRLSRLEAAAPTAEYMPSVNAEYMPSVNA